MSCHDNFLYGFINSNFRLTIVSIFQLTHSKRTKETSLFSIPIYMRYFYVTLYFHFYINYEQFSLVDESSVCILDGKFFVVASLEVDVCKRGNGTSLGMACLDAIEFCAWCWRTNTFGSLKADTPRKLPRYVLWNSAHSGP